MKPFTTAALLIALMLVTTASVAPAVPPKKGVKIYGKTSCPTYKDESSIFLTVAPSGKKVSVTVPSCSAALTPPTKYPVSAAGRFSGTRKADFSKTSHWTIKVSGRFTTPTKARGTFSAVGVIDRGGMEDTVRSGKQTFKATKQIP
jgi:hypothetical protein